MNDPRIGSGNPILKIAAFNTPKKYQVLNKALIYAPDKNTRDELDLFRRTMKSSLKLWSIYESLGIRGEMRVPSLKLVSGIHTELIQREDGILYKLDPEVVMFSKGNKHERHRLVEEVGNGETILDMFAGIGYFSIPLSFKAKKVYAIEINPDSFHYLLVNIMLNCVHNMTPMLGDCASIPFDGFADRVVMGHFDSPRYFESAIRYLKSEGKIHLHVLEKREKFDSLRNKYSRYPGVKEILVHRVKSFSPGMDHIVLDITVKKE